MPYYVAYTPALGNALAGVSDEPIAAAEGIVVEMHAENMPDLTRMAWNTATLSFMPKHVAILSKREFILRLTPIEYANIKAAAALNAELDYYWQMFMLAEEIDLAHADTVSGLQLLETAGLLALGRAAEILA